MTPDAPRYRRILVIAGSYADAAEALPLALHLARGSGAELAGVLAEDPAMLELSGAVLVSRSTLAPGPLSSERILAAFRADARAFRAHLAQLARRAALGWHFSTESGRPQDLVARLAGQGDMVLLGYRRALKLRGPVVALAARHAPRSPALAAELAKALRVPQLLLRVDDDSPDSDAQLSLSAPDAATALSALDRLAPTAVIVDEGAEGFATAGELQKLIDTARCPVLWCSASGG